MSNQKNSEELFVDIIADTKALSATISALRARRKAIGTEKFLEEINNSTNPGLDSEEMFEHINIVKSFFGD